MRPQKHGTMDTCHGGGAKVNDYAVDAGRAGFLISRIFMPMHEIKSVYPVLERAPLLLPVCWGVRIVKMLLVKESRSNAEVQLRELLIADSMLRSLKQSTLNCCHISKLYGLIALSLYRNGVVYKAHTYLNYTKYFLGHILGKPNRDGKEYAENHWHDE